MTSTLAKPAAGSGADQQGVSAELPGVGPTGLDLLALGGLLVVAVLSWVSLALAHVGAHSLPAVLGVSIPVLTVAAWLAARGRRPPVRADRAGLAVALGCAAVAALLTFPGFSYGVADKDPGGYVTHAALISRTGDFSVVDPVLASGLPVQLASPGARFGGVWIKGDAAGGVIVPQFYHLWPALLATSYDVGGMTALRLTVPLPGVLAVICLVAVLRRVGDALAVPRRAGPPDGAPRGRATAASYGIVAGLAGGLLLATNMLQVWQSRYPTTEVYAQALFVGALLGIVVALQTGWGPAAGLAGLFVGVGWLNRADGLLLVLLAVGLGAALLATRRWDNRATWFAVGLAVVAPHALRQAYDYADVYTLANGIPRLTVVVALVLACLAAALLLRALPQRWTGPALRQLEQRRVQVGIGLAVCAGAAALMTLGFLRARLFGVDLFDYNGRIIRSYDEQIMRRLSWFLTLPGLAIMGLGVAVATLSRWRAAVWTVLLPTLLLFPVYAYSARNSTRMLWWTRRYVPTVLPGIMILIALAIAFGILWRYRGRAPLRIPAALALLGLVGTFLSQSLPLRRHDEWAGSPAATARISALAGDREGLFLWEPGQGCCAGPTQLFATPLWFIHGEMSVLLPQLPERRTEIIAAYRQAFPGRPVFVVADSDQLPAGVSPAAVDPVDLFPVTLPMWDETYEERPTGAHDVRLQVAVWRVRGT